MSITMNVRIVKSKPSRTHPRKVARKARHCSRVTWRYQGSVKSIVLTGQSYITILLTSAGGSNTMTLKTRIASTLIFVCSLAVALSAQTAKHPLTLDDISHFREVRDPQLSP